MPRWEIVVAHGESVSLFYVVDAAAPGAEQPAVVYTARTREAAQAWINGQMANSAPGIGKSSALFLDEAAETSQWVEAALEIWRRHHAR